MNCPGHTARWAAELGFEPCLASTSVLSPASLIVYLVGLTDPFYDLQSPPSIKCEGLVSDL